MDAGFIQYLRDQRGFQPGDTIATKQQYDAMYKQYLKDTSGGGANFQPSAVAITNPVNTNQVVPFVTTSPNSVQPFPQERFKEGPVDKDGQQLVFDPMTGTYFPGTNRATQSVVKPKASKGALPVRFGPDGRMILLPGAEDEMPTPTNMPTPTASVAPAGAGAFETNAPVPMAAPTSSASMGMGMAPTNAMSMAPAAAAAPAPDAAMSADQVRAAYRAGQITKEQARQLLGVR